MKQYKTTFENLNGKRAMSFVGRTYARIQHYLKRAKMSLDAVCIVTKNASVMIFMDGIVLLEAVKDTFTENWDVRVTNKLANMLEMRS